MKRSMSMASYSTSNSTLPIPSAVASNLGNRIEQLLNSSINSLEITQSEWTKASIWQICNNQFTATKRRHHCRLCGNSICNDHSRKRVLINNKQSRIWDEWVKITVKAALQQEHEDEMEEANNSALQAKIQVEMAQQQSAEKEQRVRELQSTLRKAKKDNEDKQKTLQQRLNEKEKKLRSERDLYKNLQKKQGSVQDEYSLGMSTLAKYEDKIENFKQILERSRTKAAVMPLAPQPIEPEEQPKYKYQSTPCIIF